MQSTHSRTHAERKQRHQMSQMERTRRRLLHNLVKIETPPRCPPRLAARTIQRCCKKRQQHQHQHQQEKKIKLFPHRINVGRARRIKKTASSSRFWPPLCSVILVTAWSKNTLSLARWTPQLSGAVGEENKLGPSESKQTEGTYTAAKDLKYRADFGE